MARFCGPVNVCQRWHSAVCEEGLCANIQFHGGWTIRTCGCRVRNAGAVQVALSLLIEEIVYSHMYAPYG